MWYISSSSLLVFMTVIKMYFLPKLSEEQSKKLLRIEIMQGLLLFLVVALLGFTMLFILREWITIILFSKEFLPLVDLFFWQLLGDFFKLGGTFFGILLAAKAKNIRVIITNVLFSALFLIFVYFFIDELGLEGVVFAHFINNLIYIFFVFLISWDILYGKDCNNNTNI